MDIAICIATYQRPQGLRRLLESIDKTDYSDGLITIFIADNDGDCSDGFKYINEHRNDHRFEICCQIEPIAGISHARNRTMSMVRESGKTVDFIAFTDDDMTVSPHWISDLVSAATIFQADAVFGKVEPRFDVIPCTDILHSNFFQADFQCEATGTEVSEGPTSNVLFRKEVLEAVGSETFDPHLTLSGGEDIDLCMRLKANGTYFVRCASAVAYAHYPVQRLTKSWIENRYFRSGSTYSYMLRKHSSRSRYRLEVILKLTKLPYLYIRWLLKRDLNARCKLNTYTGFLFHYRKGSVIDEYERSSPTPSFVSRA